MIIIYTMKEPGEGLTLLEEELAEEPDFSVEKREYGKKHKKKEALPDAVLLKEEDLSGKHLKEEDGIRGYEKAVGIYLAENGEVPEKPGVFLREQVYSKDIYVRMLAEEIREAVFVNRVLGPAGKMDRMDARRASVRRLLDRVGIPRHQRGSFYLVDLLLVLQSHKRFLNRLMGKAYPMVAEKYGVTAVSVERAVRYSLKTVWQREQLPFLEELFPKERYAGIVPANKEWLVSLLCVLEQEEQRTEGKG